MKINSNAYKTTLDRLRSHMENIPPKNRKRLISHISFMSGAPVVVVCLYLITFIYIDDEELKDRYKTIVKFYNYKEVTPFEKGEII